MVFEHILCGIVLDREHRLTPASQRAVEQSRAIARHTAASITLFHSTWEDEVAEMVVGGVLLRGGQSPAVVETLERERATLEAAGHPSNVVIDADRPWLTITKSVLAGETDLVVVAKRNEPRPDAGRLGRNTLKLLRKCPCPIWLVHPQQELLNRSILAATDLTEVGNRTVRLGALLAAEWGCTLAVVHVLESARRSEAEAREAIRTVLSEARAVESPRVLVDAGVPSGRLIEVVDELDPDLLVMGTVSRTGIPGLLVGNTAERLLDQLDCALLTVKPIDFSSPVRLD